MKVSDIMTRTTIRIHMDDTLEKVRSLFHEHRFHHLMVTDRNVLVGVISDRDLLKNVSPFINKMAERPQDLATLNKRVHQVMSRQPVVATEEEDVEVVGCRMLDHRVSCLPVVDDAMHPLGIITWRDLMSALCHCEVRAAEEASTETAESAPSDEPAEPELTRG